LEILSALLKSPQTQALFQVKDETGSTPLGFAVKDGKLDVVARIVSILPETIRANSDYTLAHTAAGKKNWAVLEIFAKYYPQVFLMKNGFGKTPLQMAKEGGAPLNVLNFLEERIRESQI
jgi:hypothetical protein